MVNDRIWLSSPTMHEDEWGYIKKAFDTNWVAPLGPNVSEFEQVTAQYVGVDHAAALSAGTAALHLAVKLAGIKQGDKVLCSDLTFSATVNPVSYEGGEQVFIDSERNTWNMDPKALEKAFDKYPETKAVIVANLYGTPAKLDELREITEAHDAIFIEDAAESLGATYKGKMTGSFGKYNALSYNGNKIITTSGGGMLLSDDEEAIKKAFIKIAAYFKNSVVPTQGKMLMIEAGDTVLVLSQTLLDAENKDTSEYSMDRRATYVYRRVADKWLCAIDNSYGTTLLD